MRGDRQVGAKRPGLVRPGQRALQRPDFLTFTRAVPGMAGYLRSLPAVPEGRVHPDETTGHPAIDCVCDALPLPLGTARSVECACGRLFVDLGHGEIRVVPAEPTESIVDAAGDLVCEQHPELEWPHGDCDGPGMPRSAVEA